MRSLWNNAARVARRGVGAGNVERLVQSVSQRFPVRVARVVHQTAHGAGDYVRRFEVPVGPRLPEWRNGSVDQGRIDAANGLMAGPESVRLGGGATLHQDVCGLQQGMKGAAARRGRYVKADAPFVGVEVEERNRLFEVGIVAGERAGAAHRVSGGRRFYLDYVGPVVGQQLGAERSGYPAADFQHPNSGQEAAAGMVQDRWSNHSQTNPSEHLKECYHPECYHPECYHPECYHPECYHPECYHPECYHPECYHSGRYHLLLRLSNCAGAVFDDRYRNVVFPAKAGIHVTSTFRDNRLTPAYGQLLM